MIRPAGMAASEPTTLRHLPFRIVGTAPLVMHGMALPDTIHPASSELVRLRGKRGKTQADYEKIAELEWRSSLWLDAGELVIPAQIIHAAFRDSAEAHFLAGVVPAGFRCRNSPWLQHDGSSSLTHLWADQRRRLRMPVWTDGVRALRTLPVFPEWAADVEVQFCPLRLNAEKVLELFRHAGEHIGIGGGRPRFGRFGVEPI